MKSILGIILIIITICACNQKPNFPIEPSITFAGISKTRVLDKLTSERTRKDVFKDSVSISINFRDGDGDLGVNQNQITELTEKGKYNYIVRRFLKLKGKFVLFDSSPNNSGNFAVLKKGIKKGPIEGTINYFIEFLPLKSLKSDTLRFEIQIMDQANNQSNIITTDSVLVYELNKDSLPK
jgi:hypothetical protein